MSDAADLIRAIAALAWPVVVAIAIFRFRQDISSLLSRITRGRAPGGWEADFEPAKLEQAKEDLAVEPEGSKTEALAEAKDLESFSLPQDLLQQFQTWQRESRSEEILKAAAVSPPAALMLLSSELERALRTAAGSVGREAWNRGPLAAARELTQMGLLPKAFESSLDVFRQARNQVAHGIAVPAEDIATVLDLGLALLDSVRAVGHEIHVVEDTSVTIYEDAKGAVPRTDVTGVILKSFSPKGFKVMTRIFPTTREHFKPGMRVAWEWNMDKSWSQSWFRSRDTDDVVLAWDSAVEFVGRDLDLGR